MYSEEFAEYQRAVRSQYFLGRMVLMIFTPVREIIQMHCSETNSVQSNKNKPNLKPDVLMKAVLTRGSDRIQAAILIILSSNKISDAALQQLSKYLPRGPELPEAKERDTLAEFVGCF
jgi:hypothetical protein